MDNHIEFKDPWFGSSSTNEEGGLKITYPVADQDNIGYAIEQIKFASESYFASNRVEEIQVKLDTLDRYFSDLDSQEIKNLVELIHKTSGFSKHDIEKYGLGLFSMLVNYDQEPRGKYILQALKNNRIIEAGQGYLKRYGIANPFVKWREPDLLSHFISGNVVGYTAILSRIGFPLIKGGAAQILKLPSASAFFPLVYLDKLKEIDSDLRKTIACGYWKGGDDSIEKTIIEESGAINILSSDIVIRDLKLRIKKYNPEIIPLLHGHKIGFAYIARQFLEEPGKLSKVLDGLVRDISAFDGGACYTVKNIYVQGDPVRFGEKLFERLDRFAETDSPVSEKNKAVGDSLFQVFSGSSRVLSTVDKRAFVRIEQNAEFWIPDELHRYVQVMPVIDERQVCDIVKKHKHYLQTAIIAVPDEKIVPVFDLLGKAGVSNIHYPGSAAFLQVYEEPHDGEFDFIKIRYNYSGRFAATNFKKNNDWLGV